MHVFQYLYLFGCSVSVSILYSFQCLYLSIFVPFFNIVCIWFNTFLYLFQCSLKCLQYARQTHILVFIVFSASATVKIAQHSLHKSPLILVILQSKLTKWIFGKSVKKRPNENREVLGKKNKYWNFFPVPPIYQPGVFAFWELPVTIMWNKVAGIRFVLQFL